MTQLPPLLAGKLADFRKRVWIVKLIEGLLAGLFGLLVSYVLVFALDRIFDTPAWLRGTLLIAGAAVLGLGLPLKWHRWVWKQRRLEDAARLLRRTFPRLGDQLLGIVELAHMESGDAGRSERLVEAAMVQADEAVKDRDFSQAVPEARHRHWAWACGAVAALVLTGFWFAGDAAFNAFERWFMPWKAVERYTFARIEAIPDPWVVPFAEPVELEVSPASEALWAPPSASASIPKQPVARSERGVDGSYVLKLPPQKEDTQINLVVGDVRRELDLLPRPRPEMSKLLVRLTLPDYLEYQNMPEVEVRGGSVSVLKGADAQFMIESIRPLARAKMDGIEQPIENGNIVTLAAKIGEEQETHDFSWVDELGLTPRESLHLNVVPVEDEAPRIVARRETLEQVVLDTEVVLFDISAADDFGVKRTGLSWRPFEGFGNKAMEPAQGEKIVAAGGAEMRQLDTKATFSAAREGIMPQSIEIRAWAEDLLPGRERSHSAAFVLHILNAADHQLWLTQQMGKWLDLAKETYEREVQLHQTNLELRELSTEELDQPQNRRKIAQQAASEQANAARLEALNEAGQKLAEQATRNPEFEAKRLEEWAQMLEALDEIAAKRMPSVAELLKEAANSQAGKQASAPSEQGKPGESGKPSDGESGEPKSGESGKPSESKPTAGQEGQPGKPSDGEMNNAQKSQPGEAGQPGESGKPSEGQEATASTPGQPGQPSEGKPSESSPGQSQQGEPGKPSDSQQASKPSEGQSGKPSEGQQASSPPSESESKPGEPSQGQASGQPQGPQIKKGDLASEGGASEPGKPSDPKEPKEPTPSINISDAALAKNEDDKERPPSKSGESGSGGLGLPGNTIGSAVADGDPPPGGPPPPENEVEDKLDKGLWEQRNLLEEFARVTDALTNILGSLEGSTFVKRLKAASREQLILAGNVQNKTLESFGLNPPPPPPSKKPQTPSSKRGPREGGLNQQIQIEAGNAVGNLRLQVDALEAGIVGAVAAGEIVVDAQQDAPKGEQPANPGQPPEGDAPLVISKELKDLPSGEEMVAGLSKASLEDARKMLTGKSSQQSEVVGILQGDLNAFLQRRPNPSLQKVHDEMKEVQVVRALAKVGDKTKSWLSGHAIAGAEYWADVLDRWAEEMVDATPPPPDGPPPPSADKPSLPPEIVLKVMQALQDEMKLREETRELENARLAMQESEHVNRSIRLSSQQTRIGVLTQSAFDDIVSLPNGAQDFGKELELIGAARHVMDEVVFFLDDAKTDSLAIGAETEVIEMLLQTNRQPPGGGGGGGGGGSPGGGGSAATASSSALSRLGSGNAMDTEPLIRSPGQSTGQSGREFPPEFKTGLDSYFNELEAGSQNNP